MGWRIPGIFTGRSQRKSMERDHMKISNDKVIDMIMETHSNSRVLKSKVTGIEEELKGIKKFQWRLQDTHAKDVKTLFEALNKVSVECADGDPIHKNWKYYSKKFGPLGGGILVIVYILWDAWMWLKTGGG